MGDDALWVLVRYKYRVRPDSGSPRTGRRQTTVPGKRILNRTLVKLGGSLLSLPDLSERLSVLLDGGIEQPYLLVGGGEAADLVRKWDTRFRLSPEHSHELAIRGMQLNACLLASLHKRFVVVSSEAEAVALADSDRVPVIDPVSWIQAAERHLPVNHHAERSWEMTSDSLAAWMSTHCEFDRLLLLKSTDLPANLPRATVADTLRENGLVDSCFPTAAASLHQLDWCNLRTDPPVIVNLW